VAEVAKPPEPLEPAFVAAEQPTPEPVVIAVVKEVPFESLPATASPSFAIGLAGLIAMAAGAVIRRSLPRLS